MPSTVADHPPAVRPPDPLTAEQIRAAVSTLFVSAPPHVAADVADRVAAIECAHRPGAVLGTNRGVVRNEPDMRFPDRPFIRESDGVRFGLGHLTEIYLLADAPAATA